MRSSLTSTGRHHGLVQCGGVRPAEAVGGLHANGLRVGTDGRVEQVIGGHGVDPRATLWHVLAAPRGGPNRARILRALDERPRNANRLADDLDLAYNTVRHHLDVLEEHDIVTSGDESYGTVYLPSERTRNHWDTVDEILTKLRE